MKTLGGARRCAVAVTAAVLVGCGGSSSTGPSATGSLTVTVTAPAGVTPSVAVSGPGGYHQTLSATQTLSGLAVGSYTVTAASVAVANPVVATVYDGTVSGGAAATVSAGATATATATASVSYAARPGTGALWIANEIGPTVIGFSMAANGTIQVPPSTLTTGGLPFGAAFDANGNLWVANYGTSQIVEYAADQLGGSGTPAPAVILSGPSISLTPVGLAFDAAGSLWVANATNSTVVAFSASQLAAGVALGGTASPTPAVMLTASGSGRAATLDSPQGLAFDASGSLWVINASNSLAKFTASQLVASGAPAASLFAGPMLVTPEGIAFDPAPTTVPIK